MKDYLKQNVSWAQQALKPNNPESSVRKCQHRGKVFDSGNYRNHISILTTFLSADWVPRYCWACVLTRCEITERIVLGLNLTCLWEFFLLRPLWRELFKQISLSSSLSACLGKRKSVQIETLTLWVLCLEIVSLGFSFLKRYHGLPL